MRIPSQLKIGAIWWEVKQVDAADINDEGIVIGCQSERNQTIKIDRDLTQEMKEATLLHEIIHCIDAQLDHNLVEMLANQLFQVLKENKLI